MKSAMIKNRIQSDILEWSLPKEILSVLLKDRMTVDFVFPNCHTLCDKLSWSHYSTFIKVENEDAGRLGGRFTVGFWYNIVERANDTYREWR